MSNLDLVKACEKELSGRNNRMDADKKRLSGLEEDRYRLVDLDNPGVYLDKVVNVTTNVAATYVHDLAMLISQAIIQTVIQGTKNNRPLNEKENGIIESFLNAHYEMIDDELNEQGESSLMGWLGNHIVSRGWIAARYCAWVEDEVYKPDLALWDARWTASNGKKWASYRTWRFPDEINAEAEGRGKSVTLHNTVPNKTGVEEVEEVECVTFYDGAVEELWAGDLLVTTWEHGLGYVPVIIQPAPAGFMFRDKGYMQSEGESALFLDRLLYDEFNRSVSIEQTLAQKAAMPAYTQEKQAPGAPADEYPDKTGTTTAYNPTESPKLLEVGDFNQAAQLGRRDIMELLQQGGRNVDIGNINQPFSAVAIATIEEIRKKALIPRFQAIAAFRQKLSRMMIEQYKALAKTSRFKELLGLTGKKRLYKASALDGEWTIRYRFMSKSKEMEIANLAIASVAKNSLGLPDEVIVRDILLAENPDELLAKIAAQKAEQVEPWIMLIRLAHRLVDEADGLDEDEKNAKLLEARGLTEKAVLLINPPAMGTVEKPELPEPKGGNLLLPLLGAGNRGGNGTGTVTEG